MRQDLVRLVYASRASPQCDGSMLRAILTHARQSNAANDVSGFLLFDSGVFAQWLEGNAHVVHQVWDRIQKDTRHTDAKIISLARVDSRCFNKWKMGISCPPFGLAEELDGIAHSLVQRLDQIVLLPEKLFNIFDTLSELNRLREM